MRLLALAAALVLSACGGKPAPATPSPGGGEAYGGEAYGGEAYSGDAEGERRPDPCGGDPDGY